MSAAELRRGVTVWVQHTRDLKRDVFVGVVTEVERSVRIGSPITGSPGQAVQTGRLRGSWIGEFVSAWVWQFTTGLPYASAIENAVGPYGPLTLRASVGGFHSIALTIAGYSAIVVGYVAHRLADNAGGDRV